MTEINIDFKGVKLENADVHRAVTLGNTKFRGRLECF